MRDGVELLADHYEPITDNPAGTLLVRCPYGRRYPFTALYAGVYASRGYHVVFQSVRGTFGSGGEFNPMVDEIADGADTVDWLRRQPWFTGSFATIGLSYLGFTQWALMADPPPEMRAAVITVGPHDVSGPRWGAGTFAMSDFLGWSDLVANQEDPRKLRMVVRQLRARRALARATSALPVGQAGRALLGEGAPWWESWLDHPEPDDPFWSRMNLGEALDRTEIPVLLIGGWQDVFLEQTLAQYDRLKRRGVNVAMTIGAVDAHAHDRQGGTDGDPRVARLARCPSRGSGHDPQPGAYRGQRGGLDRPAGLAARDARTRAVPATDWAPWRCGAAGHRARGTVHLQPGPSDAHDRRPAAGARGGYRKDEKLAERPDVLCFTGDRLPTDLYVVGAPVIELAHSCDNPYHDLFVRVSEVDAKGTSRNVSDGYQRGTTDSGTVRIELDATAHRFRAGSRIRVLVAGGSHPRFARNLGTSEPLVSGSQLMVASHTVDLSEGASRLLLPAGPTLP